MTETIMLKQKIKNFFSSLTKLGTGLEVEESYIVISKKTIISGDIDAENLYVDGEFTSQNSTIKNLKISNFGTMFLDKIENVVPVLELQNIEVEGIFVGNIKAENVILRNYAIFEGNITYSGSLTIEKNVKINGNIKYINTTNGLIF